MSRDKQTEIEEMTMVLTESQHAFDKAWKECFHNNAPMPDRENVFYAKYLVEKEGYRKASEVAREIFEEIEKILDRHSISYHKVGEICGEHYYDGVMQFDIDELKKKYIGKDTNVTTKTEEGK